MSEHMPFVYDDGGRATSGARGSAGDCVARAVAIASGKSYAEVYAALAQGAGAERKSRGASARNGVHVRRKWFGEYMRAIGFEWTPTMRIGSGCKVHLVQGELPGGRLVVSVSKHYTAVIDGVVHDTYDPQRTTAVMEFDAEGRGEFVRNTERCVYGYWRFVTPRADTHSHAR